jgi:16S rRNA (cytosine1402-N4)-methyltransferase
MNDQDPMSPGSENLPYHVPVLLKECLEGLAIQEGGVYVDVTFGGGGHSTEIFNKLTKGKLLAFDQDPDAAQNAAKIESDAERSFVFVAANFRYLKKYLKFYRVEQVDGILADLGVSSHQFDEGKRGFSTRYEGELDMRMDQQSEKTAATVINTYDESSLVHMLSYYGDIKNARTLAKSIVQTRQLSPITTTRQLSELAEKLAPKGKNAKYLAQLFQAIRIEVNEEMEALKEMLVQAVEVLKPGGRLVVMSYHSLEDRLVKNLMNSGRLDGKIEKDFYGNLIRPLDPENRKPIVPSPSEIESNSRARSAKLRIGIKRK